MLKVTNPANDEIISEIACDTEESIKSNLKLARKAQNDWQKSPDRDRIFIIQNFWKQLLNNADRCAHATSQETGRPINQVLSEIKASGPRIQFFVENFQSVMKEASVFNDANVEELVTWDPLGVIANISAWNYPYFVGINVIIPALLTGNAVLYKPSEFATLTGLKIADMFQNAGLPEGLFTPVIGNGEVGGALIKQDIDGVFFTGSYDTGRKINMDVASKLIKVGLELGGKDPCYICEDIDINAAASAVADGVFYNCGQSCCSVERIYVQKNVYDLFVKAFLNTVKQFKIGQPDQKDTYLGPLTRKPQIKILEDQISDAFTKGAKILTGGKAMKGPGNYFEPTVLVDVNHSMKLMREESFGPIIGIQKVDTDSEAIKLMNDTSYGLTASVFCQDRIRAREIMSQLNAGTVYSNCCDRVSPFTPWSGRKASGLGSTLGKVGIETFLQPKSWHIK